MKPRSWVQSTDEELRDGVNALKKEQYILKSEYKFARKVEKPHRLRLIRRDIARALTESRARQLPAEESATQPIRG